MANAETQPISVESHSEALGIFNSLKGNGYLNVGLNLPDAVKLIDNLGVNKFRYGTDKIPQELTVTFPTDQNAVDKLPNNIFFITSTVEDENPQTNAAGARIQYKPMEYIAVIETKPDGRLEAEITTTLAREKFERLMEKIGLSIWTRMKLEHKQNHRHRSTWHKAA